MNNSVGIVVSEDYNVRACYGQACCDSSPPHSSRSGRQCGHGIRISLRDVEDCKDGGLDESKNSSSRRRRRRRRKLGTSPTATSYWCCVNCNCKLSCCDIVVREGNYGSCPITRTSSDSYQSRTLCEEHWPHLQKSSRTTKSDAVEESRHIFKNACNAQAVSSMGGSCSTCTVDESILGREQLQWRASALWDISRTQGHRIKPSSYQSSWLRDAVAPTKRASYPSSSPHSSPPSRATEVVQNALRKLQIGEDGEGPKLSMLDQDFVVTSSIHEHLLLMIALTRKRETYPEKDVATSTTRRQNVFKGNFTALSAFVAFKLGRDAQRVLYEPNAGGSSLISESLSVEYFARHFQARDIVTEMEVEYCMKNWKKVDYLCTLYGERVGVSVTRAMSYPDPNQFSEDSAYKLLYKKLFGLVVARHGVKKTHNFSRCILHIWCETHSAAQLLELLYPRVSEELELIDDVIMVLTVAEGRKGRPIFYEHCLQIS